MKFRFLGYNRPLLQGTIMTITYAEAISVHSQADLLVSGETIADSLVTMAQEITATMSKDMPLVLCVLN